jgi:hypothetical protein
VTVSVRRCVPSLAYRWLTWVLTVLCETCSSFAISGSDRWVGRLRMSASRAACAVGCRAWRSSRPSGRLMTDAETVRLMTGEAVLAEESGVDSYNIGEHYRAGHVDTARHVILAAIASRTSRIRLGTSVSVLSTQDPSGSTRSSPPSTRSRAAARSSSSDARIDGIVPAVRVDLADYETLFEEKLDLLTRLFRDQPVTWSGTVRAPLREQRVGPGIESGSIPTWVGVGGNPQSVIRAARTGCR